MSMPAITSSSLHSLASDKIVLTSGTKNDNMLEKDAKSGLDSDKATFSEASLQTTLSQNDKAKSSGSASEGSSTFLLSEEGSSINVIQTVGKNSHGEDIKEYSFTYEREVEASTFVDYDNDTTTEVRGGTIKINETFTEDVQIVENKDGTTSVFFADSNKTHIYATDGSVTEVAGNALDSTSDKIIFNTTATSVSTGGDQSGHRGTSESWGHDTIISYVDDVNISTGYGQDTVYLMGKNQSVDLGEGSNSVIADEMFGGSISSNGTLNLKANLLDNVNVFAMYDKVLGRNTIDVDKVNNSEFILRGNNELNIGTAENSKFTLGGVYIIKDPVTGIEVEYSYFHNVNGNFKNSSLDIIDNEKGKTEFNATFENSELSMGDSHNRGSLVLSDSSSMVAGNGNNSFSMDIKNNSSVAMGNGTNSLRLDIENSALKLGNGDNRIKASIIKDSDISLGDGDNRFDMQDATGNTSIALGDGNNIITARALADSTKLSVGDGINDIKIQAATGNASVTMGDGSNKFAAHTLDENARIEAGNGDNSIQVYSMLGTSGLQLGTGDNSVNVAIRSDTSSFNAGKFKEAPFDPESVEYFKDSKDILSTYANFSTGREETPHHNISKFKLNA